MNTPSYAEQWQKLTSAYVNNKVIPMLNCACFVGNLLNGNSDWCFIRNFHNVENGVEISKELPGDLFKLGMKNVFEQSNGLYTAEDIIRLEDRFMNTYASNGGDVKPRPGEIPVNEEALFKAFESTLELLKEIHISKGEVIEETPVFTKRVLVS